MASNYNDSRRSRGPLKRRVQRQSYIILFAICGSYGYDIESKLVPQENNTRNVNFVASLSWPPMIFLDGNSIAADTILKNLSVLLKLLSLGNEVVFFLTYKCQPIFHQDAYLFGWVHGSEACNKARNSTVRLVRNGYQYSNLLLISTMYRNF